MDDILSADFSYQSDLGHMLGGWIENNYYRGWAVARGSERGIAVHHGRLPRALGQLFVHLFNDEVINVLICTSTLIEGVNTSAANVFIYDKKINRTDFDFFSFANIRGRVGRMMRHFVGNAYLYHEPPTEIETRVEVPVLSDPGSSTDFLVMNVARHELSQLGRERQEELPHTTGLNADILREHGSIGVDLLVALNRRIVEILEANRSLLVWTGFPDKEQRKAIAELALMVAHRRQERTGLHTPAQIGWSWLQLRVICTLPKFLRWFVGTFFSSDTAAGIDSAFQFLQACDFGFPRSLAAIELLVLNAQPGAVIGYGPYIRTIENWFRPIWMKELDEAGVPLPLAERLARYLSDPQDKSEAIERIGALNLDR